MPSVSLRALFMPAFFLLLALCAATQPAQAAKDRPIILHLPAETLLTLLQKTTPFAVPMESKKAQGEIMVEELQKLSVKENLVSIRGVFSARNTSVNTQIAGQEVRLRIGQLRTTLHCDLQLRFDRKTQTLFLKPRFSSPPGDGQDATLTPLLMALNNREFPLEVKKMLAKLRIPAGDKTIALPMEAVRIYGADNTLVLHLQPE